MAYTKHVWADLPEETSAIQAVKLNAMEQGIYDANIDGTTGGTTTALTINVLDFQLKDMISIIAKLGTAIAANATLNVSGTGAKQIWTSAGQRVPAGHSAGAIVQFVYNATNGYWYLIGGAISSNPSFSSVDVAGKVEADTIEATKIVGAVFI